MIDLVDVPSAYLSQSDISVVFIIEARSEDLLVKSDLEAAVEIVLLLVCQLRDLAAAGLKQVIFNREENCVASHIIETQNVRRFPLDFVFRYSHLHSIVAH